MSKEIFRRLVEINARVDGKMQRRWVEVRVDVELLAQDYGKRAYASSGGRAQLAHGAVVVNTVATDVARRNFNVPTGTTPEPTDDRDGVIVGMQNETFWNNASRGSLDRKGKK